MSKMYIYGLKPVIINGKESLVPVYGNFCPKCCTSSNEVTCYNGGLAICVKCNHVFQIQDIEKQIDDALHFFWE